MPWLLVASLWAPSLEARVNHDPLVDRDPYSWLIRIHIYIYIPGTLNNQFFMDVW